MNEDTGKKVLIGGGAIALVAVVWNQVYSSGFQDGLIAAGAPVEQWGRYHGPGFPFGLLFLFGIGALIFFKMSRNGRRGPGFSGFGGFGPRRPFFDDRRQPWQPPQGTPFGQAPQRGPFGQAPQGGPFGQPPAGAPYGGPGGQGWPQQPGQAPQAPSAQAPYSYGQATPAPGPDAAPQPPITPAPAAEQPARPAPDGPVNPPLV